MDNHKYSYMNNKYNCNYNWKNNLYIPSSKKKTYNLSLVSK